MQSLLLVASYPGQCKRLVSSAPLSDMTIVTNLLLSTLLKVAPASRTSCYSCLIPATATLRPWPMPAGQPSRPVGETTPMRQETTPTWQETTPTRQETTRTQQETTPMRQETTPMRQGPHPLERTVMIVCLQLSCRCGICITLATLLHVYMYFALLPHALLYNGTPFKGHS